MVYSDDDDALIQCGLTGPENIPHPDRKISKIRRRTVFRQFFGAAGLAVSGVALTTLFDKEASAHDSWPKTIRDQLRSVQRHENAHVAFLLSTLKGKARPKPTFKNLTSKNNYEFQRSTAAPSKAQ